MKKRTNIMYSNLGRILFVEDEKFLLDMYQSYFEKNGYDFLTTDNIKKALTITEFEQPNAVLLDIIIPKPENTVAEQGYEYLEAVKKNPKIKDIPIIVFTNLDTDKDREKCQRIGAAAYIFKNATTPKQVLDTVAKIIEKYRGKNK